MREVPDAAVGRAVPVGCAEGGQDRQRELRAPVLDKVANDGEGDDGRQRADEARDQRLVDIEPEDEGERDEQDRRTQRVLHVALAVGRDDAG